MLGGLFEALAGDIAHHRVETSGTQVDVRPVQGTDIDLRNRRLMTLDGLGIALGKSRSMEGLQLDPDMLHGQP